MKREGKRDRGKEDKEEAGQKERESEGEREGGRREREREREAAKRERGEREGRGKVREGRVVPRQATIGSSDDNTETKHGVIPKLVILISAAFGKDWS